MEERNNDHMMDKGQACDDCELLFVSAHGLQRHLKRGWCQENNEPPAKRMKTQDPDGSDSDHEDNVEENEGFLLLWNRVKPECKGKFDKIYQQYVDEGEDQEDATEMAEDQMKPFEERKFFQKYGSLLEHYWLPLLNNDTHTKIVESIKMLIGK